MSLQSISPQAAADLVAKGAVLVDIREAEEQARIRIPGAVSAPVSKIASIDLPKDTSAVIFHCKSGMRTGANAAMLAGKTDCDAYLVEGGLDAWVKSGLPHIVDRKQPIEIMRQVQIGAGSLVLVGVLLGWFVAPGWYALSGLVGAGLVFAGTTGFCGMTRVLASAPWNRRASA
jgi:rhodanese-related sulfurtransferase